MQSVTATIGLINHKAVKTKRELSRQPCNGMDDLAQAKRVTSINGLILLELQQAPPQILQPLHVFN